MPENSETYKKLKYAKLLATRMELYRKLPLLWLQERLKENPIDYHWSLHPEYNNHKWDGDKDPLKNAWNALANGQWAAISAATSTSKTYFLARVVLWFLDVYHDSLVVTTAPTENQLKRHLWQEVTKIFHKFKAIRPNAEISTLTLRVDRSRDEGKPIEDGWQAVGFATNTGADETSSTRAQGYHRANMLFIVEETPGVNNAIMEAIINTSTGSKNMILAVGNPDNAVDSLANFASLSRVKHFRISAYDYPNVVLNQELYKGAVTKQSIETRKDRYGEQSPMYLSRVRGITPSSSIESLIQLEWLQQCIINDISEAEVDNSYNAVGVDVANSIDGDKAAAVYGTANICTDIFEFQCNNASHLAFNLIYNSFELANKGYNDYGIIPINEKYIDAQYIGVDSVGIGAATVQTLQNDGYNCTPLYGGQWTEAIPTTENGGLLFVFASLRSQMYYEAREDLRNRRVFIMLNDKAVERQLIKEMVIPKVDAKNKITVEEKEKIKKRLGGKSPNVADAFIYWNWIRKGYRSESNLVIIPQSL